MITTGKTLGGALPDAPPEHPARLPRFPQRLSARAIYSLARLRPYAIAVAVTLLGLLLRFLIDPWLGDQMPYITFVLAVAVTGFYAGVRPALVSAVLGGATAYWCFVPPRYGFGFRGVSDTVGFGVYVAAAAGVILLVAERQRAHRTARRALEQQIAAEQKLIDAQALLRSFLDDSPAAAYLRDEQGRYPYANAAARQLLGLPQSAGPTAPAAPPSLDSEQSRQQDEEVLRSGRTLQFMDRSVGPDGQRYWLTTKFPFVDLQGRRFVGANCLDITDQIRAEEVLRKSERFSGSSQMASLLAHHINNPLAAVTNVLFLLGGEPLSDTGRKYLDLANEELSRVSHIARLTLGLYAAGVPIPAATDICDVIDEVTELLQTSDAFRHLVIQREYACHPTVVATSTGLHELVTNLLVNAQEAGAGRVRVRVSLVRERAPLAPGGIRLTVADDGRGIPRPDAARVFDPFFTTKRQKGMGLGLWACRAIVARNQGSIRISSRDSGPHTGTCVQVFLPGAQASAPAAPDSKPVSSVQPRAGYSRAVS